MRTQIEAYPLGVQTSFGPDTVSDGKKPIDVISYHTGTPSGIMGVRKFPGNRRYKLTFSDGREGIYHHDELFYFDGKCISFQDLLYRIAQSTDYSISPREVFDLLNLGTDVKVLPTAELSVECPAPVNYSIQYQQGYLSPDAYTAGALLPNIDIERTYVNLPLKFADALESIQIMNRWKVCNGDGIETIAFTDLRGDRITVRDDLMNKFVRSMVDAEHSAIPSPYVICNIIQRWDFIRGFFDSNCDVRRDVRQDLTMIISAPYYDRLLTIQTIIRSLGMMAQAIEGSGTTKHPHILVVTPTSNRLESFFNLADKAETAFMLAQQFPGKKARLYLTSIKEVEPGYSFGIKLKTSRQIYLGNDFVPRVSE